MIKTVKSNGKSCINCDIIVNLLIRDSPKSIFRMYLIYWLEEKENG
jgi:hypothetical protein